MEETLLKTVEKFIPYIYIERIYEPEFGCEGRTKQEAFGDVIVYTVDKGKQLVRLEEESIWENIYDEGMILGYLKEEQEYHRAYCYNSTIKLMNIKKEDALACLLKQTAEKMNKLTNSGNEHMDINGICYRKLKEQEITLSLFQEFNRYQDVTQCWRKENENWVLKEIAFTEQWSDADYSYLVTCLKGTVKKDGTVFGAFFCGVLVGFCSIESEVFGAANKYVQLSSLHVSYEMRGKGIGKQLFYLVAEEAKLFGAQKLYISAHSSKETQVFYRKIGCGEAQEYCSKLAQAEPCDCQMEYIVGGRL